MSKSANPQTIGGVETDAEKLARLGDDALKWAEEFRMTAIHLGYPAMDTGWLITWFANAIVNGQDIVRRQSASTIERLSERCEAYKGQVESGAIAIEHQLSVMGELRAIAEDAIKRLAYCGKHLGEVYPQSKPSGDFIETGAKILQEKLAKALSHPIIGDKS